ncbi:ABC transporter ATP-binding protein/permease [Lactobacillus taiwanensis]|uniref:Multidrug ABC transporter ATP-binding protein n=2 Tax=Lactobacillus taiwanensis TaxID=508451 RepID=A0A256LJ57_9LACO|nr:ABC transporter ATP-binding protein [Lactobacillus taiwanensis]MCR1916309.1 ABC transporter ATP-binding protein/permease [Lactobacillus taiwanensis]OYR89153.1 multidrug ABC transporter ATP-binding protein [Lactobacillus taiwanensis]OYR92847.1 multidrug ABC transporter ATP-binding protein [Lactobacillus taiwanensis]OYR93475.1 multidrug ABC transporter ATP-binding protein [Lactobacillus taiwanensis]OYR97669.1 multidrug ABC transporter ATP-binding protein [Lactobacillus taiwanensis]
MEILKPHFKNYRKEIILAIVTILISAFATLWQPRLLENIQKAILADNQSTVLRDGIGLVILGLLAIVAGIFNVYYAAKIAQGITSDLREETYAKIQSFSFGNIEKFSSGSLVVRLINDMNQVMNMMMILFMQLLRMPIILVGSFVLSIITIPHYWWAPVLMLALMMGVGFVVIQNMNKLFDKFQHYMDKISTRVKENLQGVRVVKSFNQGENEIRRFNKTSDSLNELNIKIGYWISTIMPAFMLIAYLVIALVVFLVGRSANLNTTDVAVVSPYVSYILTLLFAILIGGFVIMNFTRGMVSLRRIKEVLDTEPDVKFDPNAPTAPEKGSIEFDNVSFTYPDSDKPTLENISFKVKAGEMVGIVGATGSGKSTLAQLIPRLYDPSKGTIKIGGKDLKKIGEKSLRNTVSMVLQKAILFSGTIASNLRQGKEDATDYELKRASEIAQAQEFVGQYPDEFDHEVEERSANFSGGQKQRLSIARGVIGQPPILILDDSTSALDAKSEKLVQEALEHDLKDTTTVIIAEKIVSVMNADKILVLDDGKLVAEGTHEELLKTSPIYQDIYRTQKAKEKRGKIDE